MKGILIAGFVVVLVVLGITLFNKPAEPVTQPPLGDAGTEHSTLNNFYDGLTTGGSVITYTATGTPITANELCSNRIVNVAVANGGASGNFTLASTTGVFNRCLPIVGMSVVTYFRNTSTTGSFTLVAGDSSSTVQTIALPTSTTQGVLNATTSITAGFTGKLTSFRSTSGTGALAHPWLYQLLEVYR